MLEDEVDCKPANNDSQLKNKSHNWNKALWKWVFIVIEKVRRASQYCARQFIKKNKTYKQKNPTKNQKTKSKNQKNLHFLNCFRSGSDKETQAVYTTMPMPFMDYGVPVLDSKHKERIILIE